MNFQRTWQCFFLFDEMSFLGLHFAISFYFLLYGRRDEAAPGALPFCLLPQGALLDERESARSEQFGEALT